MHVGNVHVAQSMYILSPRQHLVNLVMTCTFQSRHAFSFNSIFNRYLCTILSLSNVGRDSKAQTMGSTNHPTTTTTAASSPPYQLPGTAASTSSILSILYITIRICCANLVPILDCDEVYNYWEPLHYVLYGT